MFSLRLLLMLCIGHSSLAFAQDVTLEANRLHLGRPGQYEWDEYQNRPVDAERLERRFQAQANTGECTLRLWQRDVKLRWPVLLNGRKLGTLTTAETPQECVLAVPAGALRDGENILIIEAAASLDDIEVGPIYLTEKPVLEAIGGSRINVVVTAAPDGIPSPCRITLTRPDGTLQPLRAEPAGDVAARTGVVYMKDGRASITVPPGDYLLHAGRGFEWSVEKQALSLQRGDSKELRMSLTREVDTRGWIAADSHIHTLTFSGHGDAKIEERMLTIAGEGIEVAISTDHNHHTDYAPFAASAGLSERFTPVIGNEVTTKHGHFNAFPIQPGALVVDASEEDWAKLVPAIRATPGVKVITLNHPRDLHNGFAPFGGIQFNPKTGKHRLEADFDFDAMEVVTSGALQSDVHLLYHDWFALLNRGHRIAAVASSDSHDVNRFILGQGRTYVAVNDANPAQVDLKEVWRSYQQGRLLVSLGLLCMMKVDDRFTVGDLATGIGEKIKVEIIVSGPSWVQADRLELFANGIRIRDQVLHDDHRAGKKARFVWELPRPAHDVHLVAIATGPGVKEPFWEIPHPYQPTSKTFTPRVIGSTNPIWIDADGDGQFQSAYAIAQSLLQRFGTDREKLHEALKQYDESVVIQAKSLLEMLAE
jgi:hypothetical protein